MCVYVCASLSLSLCSYFFSRFLLYLFAALVFPSPVRIFRIFPISTRLAHSTGAAVIRLTIFVENIRGSIDRTNDDSTPITIRLLPHINTGISCKFFAVWAVSLSLPFSLAAQYIGCNKWRQFSDLRLRSNRSQLSIRFYIPSLKP